MLNRSQLLYTPSIKSKLDITYMWEDFPGGMVVKNPPVKWRHKRHRFDPRAGKIPWRRKWQSAPVFLPGKSHGQRSLKVYNPWDHRVRHDWAHTHTQMWEIKKKNALAPFRWLNNEQQNLNCEYYLNCLHMHNQTIIK